MTDIATIRRGVQDDLPVAKAVWRRSVEASHHFLTPSDIDMLEGEVEDGLAGMDVWISEVGGQMVGFMAMRGGMIEALFIAPDCMGMGLGTRFIRHARLMAGNDKPLRVDVNEQNHDAVAFYRAKGFTQIGRSATDGAGRPWPLLHMEMVADGTE